MSSIIIKDKFNRDVVFEDNFYILNDKDGTEIMKCSLLSTIESHIPEEFIKEKESIDTSKIDYCMIQMIQNKMFMNNANTESFIKQTFNDDSTINLVYLLQNASSGVLKYFIDEQTKTLNANTIVTSNIHTSNANTTNNSTQNF